MFNGRAGPRSLAGALELFEKAAAQENSGAMFALGTLNSGGHNLPVDRRVAQRWLRAAAERGNGHAQLMLGPRERGGRRAEPCRGTAVAGAIAQGIAEAIEIPDRGLQKGATLRRFLIEPANIPDDRFRTSRTMVQHRLTAGAHRSGRFYE